MRLSLLLICLIFKRFPLALGLFFVFEDSLHLFESPQYIKYTWIKRHTFICETPNPSLRGIEVEPDVPSLLGF